MRAPRTLLPVACMALASVACSCRKELTADAIEKSPAAIAQAGPSGTATWVVGPDGTVKGTLRTPEGKRVAQPVTGQIAFAIPDKPPASVPVQYDPETGVLTAAGPKLETDLTPVSYTLSAGGAPWTGLIDVPSGGTQELVDTGRVPAPLPPGAVGPNGGIVRTVGPDRIEVVANKHTGDVRAYVLDDDNRPVDPADQRITIGLAGEQPEVLLLAPEPEAHFFVGHMRGRIDPPYMTVAVRRPGATHACLVGWSPGSVVVLGPRAPRLPLLAVEAWPGEVVEGHGPHGRFHGDVLVGGPGVVVGAPGMVVEAPSLVVAPPRVVVGAPGFAVGPGVVFGEGAEGHGRHGGPGHGHEHGHGR